MNNPLFNQINKTARKINKLIAPRRPKIGVILGSGLGAFADNLTEAIQIPYKRIPGFAQSKIIGHVGRLVAGMCGNTSVLVMQGRVHLYEGHPIDKVILGTRAMIMAGCKTIILTNAAGGINRAYSPGDLVIISDHINFTGQNPLTGDNDERLGPRFPDMSEVYSSALRQHAIRCGRELNIQHLRDSGVYCWLTGPSYETPTEVAMLSKIGADLAGMSTVPEAIAARHMGADVLGISCVTNMAAGISPSPLSHAEVQETAGRIKNEFIKLLERIIQTIS